MCKHLYAVFLFLLAFLPAGGWAAGGIDFHPIEGQTYVIMNAETGEFLYYAEGDKLVGKYYPFMTINDNITKPSSLNQRWEKLSDLKDASVLLWGFEKSGIGDFSYRLYNKGTKSNQYVMKTTGKKYDYYYFTDNQSEATPLYFIRSPYNIDGYMVSASPDFKKNMWYISYSEEGKNGYYIYDSGTAPLSLLSVSKTTTKDPGKDLSSFRFLTYDDLWAMYQQLKSASEKGLYGGGCTLFRHLCCS